MADGAREDALDIARSLPANGETGGGRKGALGAREGNESVLSRLSLNGLGRLGADELVDEAVDTDRNREDFSAGTGGMDRPEVNDEALLRESE